MPGKAACNAFVDVSICPYTVFTERPMCSSSQNRGALVFVLRCSDTAFRTPWLIVSMEYTLCVRLEAC